MIVKISGDQLSIDSAIRYAARNGSKLMNISSGWRGREGTYLKEAVDSASADGVILICGAGNDSTKWISSNTSVLWPAKYSATHSNVICVASTDPWDRGSSFSSRGSEVTLSAPGGLGWYYENHGDGGDIEINLPWNVMTTAPNYFYPSERGYYGCYHENYSFVAGTSISAPIVTGIVALMLAVNPTLNPEKIRDVLQSTVDVPSGWNSQYGVGRVNAYKAVLAVLQPVLSQPAVGGTTAPSLTFVWRFPYNSYAQGEVAYFKFQIATQNSFGTPIYDSVTQVQDTSVAVSCLPYATTYYWRVAAKLDDSSTVWSDTWQFSTPSVPQLSSPANSAYTSTPTTLAWNAASGVASYRLQLSKNSSFSNPLKKDSIGITATSYLASGLGEDTPYYWRVCPHYCGDTTGWSPTWSFHVVSAPTLSSPSNGLHNQSTTLTLGWNASSGAPSYRVQLSTDSTFSTFFINDSNVTTTSKAVSNLQYFTTYFWRVRAVYTIGMSSWSNPFWNFTVCGRPPTLSSPSNCSTVTRPPLLKWYPTGSSQLLSYRLQVDTNTNFSNPAVNVGGITDTSDSATGLVNTSTYYWRVGALMTDSAISWSDTWFFRTAPPPAPVLGGAGFNEGFHPLLSWTTSTWCNVTYVLYRFRCSDPDDCLQTETMYSGQNTSFTDTTWDSGHYSYSANYYVVAKDIGSGQSSSHSDTLTYGSDRDDSKRVAPGAKTAAKLPSQTALQGNFPDPFNPQTIISYALPQPTYVKLTVYDMFGQEIRVLVDGFLDAGFRSATFDASNLASGVYFCRLQAGKFSQVKKMLLLR